MVGRTDRDPPAAAALGNLVIVPGGVKAEERQLEAVLPARLPVAAARIAAMATKERHDLALKIDRPRLSKTADGHFRRSRFTTAGRSNRGLAIGPRHEITMLVNEGNRRRRRSKRRLARKVTHPVAD